MEKSDKKVCENNTVYIYSDKHTYTVMYTVLLSIHKN